MYEKKKEFDLNTLVEVTLPDPDNFLKVKETLTRIGVASHAQKKLWQSCHILHKKGKFYIIHFKELFLLDGKNSTFNDEDKARRNTIANMLAEWKLVNLVDVAKSAAPVIEKEKIKVLSFEQKKEWTQVEKYQIGKIKKEAVAQ